MTPANAVLARTTNVRIPLFEKLFIGEGKFGCIVKWEFPHGSPYAVAIVPCLPSSKDVDDAPMRAAHGGEATFEPDLDDIRLMTVDQASREAKAYELSNVVWPGQAPHLLVLLLFWGAGQDLFHSGLSDARKQEFNEATAHLNPAGVATVGATTQGDAPDSEVRNAIKRFLRNRNKQVLTNDDFVISA